MKTSASFLAAVIALGIGSHPARADISVGVFYDSLDPYGDWVEVADYGYCWSPREVDNDWRPYTDGEWAYTDVGWTWVSDEPYGWAVYHYGRWLRTDSAGWVWVPGEEWGPAWVSWRRSPEYVGWAPLPPEARFSASVGISRNVDVEFDIGPAFYSFVTVRNFGSERLRPVIIEPQRNVTIINETRNITNITYVNKTVINRGPDYAVISKESQRPIRKLKLNRRTDFSGGSELIRGGAKIDGDSLTIPAPRIERGTAGKPKKVGKKIAKEQINRGWKGLGPDAEIEKVRAKMKREESEPEPELAETSKPEKSPARELAAPQDPSKAAAKAERKAAKAAAAETDETDRPARAAEKSDPSVKAAKMERKAEKQAVANRERPDAPPEKPKGELKTRGRDLQNEGDRSPQRSDGRVKPDRPEPPRERLEAARQRPDSPKPGKVKPLESAPRDLAPPAPKGPRPGQGAPGDGAGKVGKANGKKNDKDKDGEKEKGRGE